MSLQIAHIVYSFGVGGLERVIANLINYSTDDDVTHHIITLTDDQAFANQLHSNVNFYCVNKKPGKDLLCHLRMYKLLREIKPDVVHSYNFGTIEYHFSAWLAGVPVRIHAEHGRESSYKKIDKPSRYELFRKCLIPFITFFVVVSKDLEDWAKSRLGLTAKKLRLIHNGIPLDEFSNTGSINPQPNDFVAITVGRLVDVKNQALLINAFAEASERCPAFSSAKLRIVGEGPNYHKLAALINVLRLDSRVELLGRRDDIAALMRSSTVFILSSRYEAMPMTALEAMAGRLPVIAPNVGGVPFILEHKKNGFMVESESVASMAEALVYAFEHRQELSAMGEAGFSRVNREFSVEYMNRAYFSLYRSASENELTN